MKTFNASVNMIGYCPFVATIEAENAKQAREIAVKRFERMNEIEVALDETIAMRVKFYAPHVECIRAK